MLLNKFILFIILLNYFQVSLCMEQPSSGPQGKIMSQDNPGDNRKKNCCNNCLDKLSDCLNKIDDNVVACCLKYFCNENKVCGCGPSDKFCNKYCSWMLCDCCGEGDYD